MDFIWGFFDDIEYDRRWKKLFMDGMTFIEDLCMAKHATHITKLCNLFFEPRLKPICADRAETDLYVFSDICDVMN